MDETCITRLSVLSGEQAQSVTEDIDSLRHRWIRRSTDETFYTLGRATYIDVVRNVNRSGTRDAIVRENAVLKARFGQVFAALSSSLASHLDRDISFHPHLCLPGFHIFQNGGVPRADTASVHFDLQWLEYLGMDDLRSAEPISFTLPIVLPRTGAHLNVWSLTWAPGVSVDVGAYVSREAPTHVDYRVGELVVHSGLQLHQIGGVATADGSDRRITLQGHAVCFPSRAILYW